jgi:RND superfamily putative drug exporter
MAPIILVVERPDRTLDLQDRLEAFTDAIGGFPVVETSPDKQIMTISLALPGDAATADAMKAIQTLREQTIPGAFGPYADDVHVTGWAARQADFTEVADNRQIPVIVFVLGLSFILLTLVFRSILVPLKAVIMNLLSVGAAYGLIVLVFQKGVGNEIFGFQQVESIESWLPIFLFAILFGLSMDYHVFLLSRIKEHFSETDDNRASVAHGLRSTGRIITGAALIMVVVFGGFAAGDLTLLQQMGFGLAVAVFLDATLVRSVLVPATMRLLGRRNWYLPSWLEWLPHLDIEGLRKR